MRRVIAFYRMERGEEVKRQERHMAEHRRVRQIVDEVLAVPDSLGTDGVQLVVVEVLLRKMIVNN